MILITHQLSGNFTNFNTSEKFNIFSVYQSCLITDQEEFKKAPTSADQDLNTSPSTLRFVFSSQPKKKAPDGSHLGRLSHPYIYQSTVSISEDSSNQTTKDTSPTMTELTNKVSTIENQLARILSLVQPSNSPLPGASPTDPATSTAKILKISNLSYQLPDSSAEAVSTVASTRTTYAESGKLALFKNPAQLAHFPSNRFVPKHEGLFGQIKDNDTRDGWEAETL